MTESLGRSTRWGTAAVVAPAAAAALALATGWAVANQPHPSGPPAAKPAAAQQGQRQIDHRVLDLSRQAQAQLGRVSRLERALRRLNARAEAVRRAPLPSSGGASSGGGTVLASSGGSSGSVPGPPVVSAPQPAAHASTGGS
jgi:hypothetical protein